MSDSDLLTDIVNMLLEEVDHLQEKLFYSEKERDYYFQLCQSYEMWQNRAIDRIKEMQNG